MLSWHDQAKRISQLLLLNQVMQHNSGFLLLTSLSPVHHLPGNTEFAPKYFASQNGNYSSWRRWCLQGRNFTRNVLGLSVSSGATWAFSSCAGVPASQLSAIRPGTWCFVPRSNALAWRKRASLLAHTHLGAWRISLALSYYKLVVSKVVHTFVKPQVLIAVGGQCIAALWFAGGPGHLLHLQSRYRMESRP